MSPNRRSLKGLSSLALLMSMALLPGVPSLAGAPPECGQPLPAAATAKPNIVFILTDDQDLQLGSLNYMPNLKSLVADQGLTFQNGYVPLSLCCPSRTTILRGQFPHNHQIEGNSPPLGGFEKAYSLNVESATAATALHGAGYRTVLLGKYLNGYPDTAPANYIPPGWDEWYSPSAGNPYSEYNYTLNENGTPVSYGSTPTDYMVDVLSAKAQDFIRRTVAAGPQPFFIYLATYAPHQPATPAPRHASLFPTVQAPRLPSFNEADVSDKPAYIQAMPLLTAQQIAQVDELYRQRIRSLQSVDEAIAALVSTLQSVGQLDNTYIFFTSDNAFHLGEKRMSAGKYTPYETDIRVPFMVRGPGVPKGGTMAHMTTEVDLAATWAEIAGASLPEVTDGRSLVPLLGANPPAGSSWRQAVLLEQFVSGNPLADPGFARLWSQGTYSGILEPPDPQDIAEAAKPWPAHFGYTTGTYKYVEYDTGEKELYILPNDPDEVSNKAALANPVVMNTCSLYLSALKACAGDGCRSAESIAPPPLVAPDFTYAPSQPTDVSPVLFTASAVGTAPYAFAWTLPGLSITGTTATVQLPPGDQMVTLDVQDGIGARNGVSKIVHVAPTVFINGVTPATSPFRLKIAGTNFKPGCKITLGGWPVSQVAFKSSGQVNAVGSEVKAHVPKGQAVQIVVINSDGSQNLPFTYTR